MEDIMEKIAYLKYKVKCLSESIEEDTKLREFNISKIHELEEKLKNGDY